MGQYVVVEHKGLYRFNLCDSDGHVVLSSIVFPSKNECLAGIDEVVSLAKDASVEDGTVHGFKREMAPKCRIYQDMDGQYFFTFVDDLGDDVASSHRYPKKESLLRRIGRMRKESDSPVVHEE